jgi:hypothetical protein
MKRTTIKRSTKPIRRNARPRKRRRGSQAALGRLADKLWARLVRRNGVCELAGHPCKPGLKCSGVIQAGHGWSRRYRGTRWLPINGVAICSAHHVALTHDPIAWDDFLREFWGQPTYDALRKLAIRTTKDLDLPAIVAGLDGAVRLS